MTVIHKKCNAEIKSDIDKAIRLGMTPGDYGFCTKCGKRVDHLISTGPGQMGFNKEIIIQ